MNNNKKIIISLALSAFVGTSPVWAASETEFQLDQITVTADRISQSVSQTPANVTIITAQQLEDKGARNLTEALSGVSGVTVKNFGSNGEKALPSILGSDRIIVLIDGKRMNLPQGNGYGASAVDLNSFLLGDNVDRIEVVRGGASALYGADAVGGVINIITKQGASRNTVVTTAGGNYGSRNYTFSTSGHEKKTSWHLSTLQDQSEGQRQNSAYKNQNLSLRLDQKLTNSENLTMTYDYYDSHAGLPGQMPGTLSDYQDILRRNWSTAYSRTHTDGNQTLRYYDNVQTYSGYEWGTFRHKNSVRSFEYSDSTRLNTANLLTWGGEWRKEQVESTNEGNTTHGGTTKALYVQSQINLTKAADLTLGLRYDNNSIYGTHWLPKVAYLHRAGDRVSYFANWGKVFRAPNFDDLYAIYSWGGTGNPDLKPETGWTTEIGVKSKLSKTQEGTLSIFKRNLSDAIDWYLDDDGTTWRTQNINQLNTIGLNANLTSKLSGSTTLDLGYTYLDSRDQNGAVTSDPRHTFHIGVNAKFGKLTQSIVGMYQGENGTNQVGSRFVVNTHSNYKTGKDTTVFLTVNNLFNRQYEAVKGYPAGGLSFLIGVKQGL